MAMTTESIKTGLAAKGRAATHTERPRDALAARLFQSAIAMMDILTIYLGDRLGLYRTLDNMGSGTASELAARTGTAERYVREWLEQQAVTGILEVEDARAEVDNRRYRIPHGHKEVLLDPDSLSYLAPLARQMVGLTRPLPALLEAFRTSSGVPYLDYGPDMREGIAEANRVMFINLLGTHWLPAISDVHTRLEADPPGARSRHRLRQWMVEHRHGQGLSKDPYRWLRPR